MGFSIRKFIVQLPLPFWVSFYLLVMAMILPVLAYTGTFSFGATYDGSGTPSDPYKILDCEQLQGMQDELDKSYELSGTVDCTGSGAWNAGSGFLPVGNLSTPFTGTLAGNGYAIDGLTIESDQELQGLFGATQGASITNIQLTNVSITDISNASDTHVMAPLIAVAQQTTIFVASAQGTIDFTLNGAAGGLVGQANQSTINRSWTDVDIESSSIESDSGVITVGGIAAGATETEIKNVYTKGGINLASADERSMYAGGIVGSTGSDVDVQYAYSIGPISVNNPAGTEGYGAIAGGIVGYGGYLLSVQSSFTASPITMTGQGLAFAIGARYFGAGEYAELNGTTSNNYFDKTLVGQDACTYAEDPLDDMYGCLAMNVDGSQPDYFKNNDSNPPLDAWDFTYVWAVMSEYPEFEALQNPPTVVTHPASNVTQTEAVLRGMTSPGGVSERGFEYGTDTSYGQSVQDNSSLSEYVFVDKFGEYGSGDGQFDAPRSIATDASRNAHVSDTVLNRIQKFDSNGNYLSQFGESGSGDGQFDAPGSIAVDASGNIYVADMFNYRIQKFDSSGTYLDQWGSQGTGDGEFNSLTDLALDSNSNVYVVDTGNSRIQKFDSSGNYLSKWGSSGSGNDEFLNPHGIAVDQNDDSVYVTDNGNNRIQKFDSSGNYLSQFGEYGTGPGQVDAPGDVAVDEDGSIFVSDSGNNRIQKFDASGSYATHFGSYGAGDGQFYSAHGIGVDYDGNVYVSDHVNNRVQKFARGVIAASVTGLECGTTYHFRAYSINPNGTGYGNDEQFQTTNCTEVLGVPQNLQGTTTSVSAELSWDSVDGANRYPVQYKASSDDDWILNEAQATGPDIVIGGLNPETEYDFQVKAIDIGGTSLDSEWSPTLTLTTSPRQTYHITNCQELQAIAVHPVTLEFGDPTGNYLIDNDIDCSESTTWDWVDVVGPTVQPLGFIGILDLGTGNSFSGVLDGQGHTISNLYQFTDVMPYGGLFSGLSNATVTNLKLDNFSLTTGFAQMTSGFPAGAVASQMSDSVVSDVSVTNLTMNAASINSSVGAIGGMSYMSLIENVTVSGEVTQERYTSDGLFNDPRGVTTDSSGNIYVVDRANTRVQKFNASGDFVMKWGTGGSGDGEFSQPGAIAIDSTNNVYVFDDGNNRVQKFDSNGNYLSQFGANGQGDGEFGGGAAGIAIDAAGDIYIADRGNHRVQKFDSSGMYLSQFGANGGDDGQFRSPESIDFDSSGNIYVVDSGNHRVQKFDSSGGYLTQWGTEGTGDGQFTTAVAISLDAANNVYVADTSNSRVQKFDSSGTYLDQFGGYGAEDGEMFNPMGMTISGGGTIYVVDTGNNRVQGFTTSGGYLTQWGKIGIALDLVPETTPVASGFVGTLLSTEINQSYTDVDLDFEVTTEVAPMSLIGGLTGYTYDATITDSYSHGDINTDGGAVTIGGLAGAILAYGMIERSYSASPITSTNNSVLIDEEISESVQIGGLIGFTYSDLLLNDTFYASNITTNIPAAGLIGSIRYGDNMPEVDGNIGNNYYDQTGSGQADCVGLYYNTDNDTSSSIPGGLCTPVNTDGEDDDYFINNNSNPPLDVWDFDTIWKTNSAIPPTFIGEDTPEPTTPGVPRNLEITGVSGSSLDLDWDAPTSTGNSPITDYVVQYKLSSSGTWLNFSDGTSLDTETTITGLVSGTSYDVRVAAVNAIGQGDFTASVTGSTYGIPSAPLNLEAVAAGASSANLTWDPPTSDGGTALTDYVVQYKLSSSGTWLTSSDGTSTTTNATVTGLTPNQLHDFRVAAVNNIGSGPYATVEDVLIHSLLPSAPRNLTAANGEGDEALLAWQVPLSGSPFTDYVVNYKLDSDSSWTSFSDGTSTNLGAVVAGLTNGATYDFRVAAVNLQGQGEWSNTATLQIRRLLTDCEQMQTDLLAFADTHFMLASDIDCSDTVNWNSGDGWIPAGTSGSPFTGSLDGRGYAITDIYIDGTNDNEPVGMFGWTENAQITNLELHDAIFKGAGGPLAGTVASGTEVSEVIVTGTTTGMPADEQLVLTGGLIGMVEPITADVSIHDISATINIDTDSIVGGLIGGMNYDDGYGGLSIEHVVVDGTITAGVGFGGVVGFVGQPDLSTPTEHLTISDVDVNLTASSVCSAASGGVVGFSAVGVSVSQANVELDANCDASGTVGDSHVSLVVGGIVGGVSNGVVRLSDSEAAGEIEVQHRLDTGNTVMAGGLIGVSTTALDDIDVDSLVGNQGAIVTNSTADVDIMHSTSNVPGSIGGLVAVGTVVQVTNSHGTGNITSTTPSSGNGAGRLASGGVVGFGLIVEVSSSDYDGAISATYREGTGALLGGILGANQYYARIADSHSTGTIVSNRAIAECTLVVNCGSSSTAATGGLVGLLTPQEIVSKGSVVEDSYSTSSITLEGPHTSNEFAATGGLLGVVYGDSDVIIEDSYATGGIDIDATKSYPTAGGLIGLIYTATAAVTNTHATGSVGTLESSERPIMMAGGLIGMAYGVGDISHSYATGSAEGVLAGGLIGSTVASNISDTYATGAVTQQNQPEDMGVGANPMVTGVLSAGGLIGSAYASPVTNSYASGAVAGEPVVLPPGEPSYPEEYAVLFENSKLGGLIGTYFAPSPDDDDVPFDASTISNVFSVGAVSGPADNSLSAGLIGFAMSSNQDGAPYTGYVQNSYYSGPLTGQSSCTNSYAINEDDDPITISPLPDGSVNCTNVNTVATPRYFINNTVNQPLSQWDFATVWRTNTNTYPDFVGDGGPTDPTDPVDPTDPSNPGGGTTNPDTKPPTPSNPGTSSPDPVPGTEAPTAVDQPVTSGRETPATVATPAPSATVHSAVIGPLVRLAERIPGPVARALPYSLLALLIAIALLYGYSSYLEDRRRRALLRLTDRFKVSLASRATYLQLTSHYISTPITKMQAVIELLGSGVSGTSSAASTASAMNLGAQSSTMTLPYDVVSRGREQLKSLADHAAELLAEGQSISGRQQASIRELSARRGLSMLTHPGFWLPASTILTVTMVVNVILIQAGKYSATLINIATQAMLAVVGVIALLVSYYFFQQKREQQAIAATQHQIESEILARQQQFIANASDLLNGDLAALSALEPEVRRHPKTEAFSAGRSELAHVVGQLEKLNELSKYVPGLTWNVNVGPVVSAAISDVSELSNQKSVSIQSTGSIRRTINIEEQALRHLLSAPLKNAVQASSAGMRVEVLLAESGSVSEITITDKGNGIPNDKLAAIFSPFNSVTSTERFSNTGLGLDLYLARLITDQYGGTIVINSTEGVGTQVKITLPFSQ